MKIHLPIRDVTDQLCFDDVQGLKVANPFILVQVPKLPSDGEIAGRYEIVWLEFFKSSMGGESITMDRIHRCAMWGLPISQNQTLSDYRSLQLVGNLTNAQFYKANMVGLYERMKHGKTVFGNPELDSGEAYLLRAKVGDCELFGVHADSYGAATRFVKRSHQLFNVQAYNEADEMPPLDFP